MFELAEAAVEAAIASGARYADARVMDRRHESMNARNGEIEGLSQDGAVGIGVRALIGSGWGFFSTAQLTREAAHAAGAQAAAILLTPTLLLGTWFALRPKLRRHSWALTAGGS